MFRLTFQSSHDVRDQAASDAQNHHDDLDLGLVRHPSVLLLEFRGLSSATLDEDLDLSHLDELMDDIEMSAGMAGAADRGLFRGLSVDLMRNAWGLQGDVQGGDAVADREALNGTGLEVDESRSEPSLVSGTPPQPERDARSPGTSTLQASGLGQAALDFPLIRRFRDGLADEIDERLSERMKLVMMSKSQKGRRRGSEKGPLPPNYDPPTYEEILATLLLEKPHLAALPDIKIRKAVSKMRTSRVHNKVDKWRTDAGWTKCRGTWRNAQGVEWQGQES